MIRSLSYDRLVAEFAPGEHIFIGGASGEPMGFAEALARRGDPRPLRLTTTFAPGVNPLDLESLDAAIRVDGLFMQPGWRAAQRHGRFRHLPQSYAGFLRHLREDRAPHTLVLQVSPPDAQGRCSLGPAVEFAGVVRRRARRVVGVLNAALPRLAGSPTLPIRAFDAVVELDAPPRTYVATGEAATAGLIAAGVAAYVDDGQALQIGLGKVPQALLAVLTDRRGLRLHSGILPDGIMDLAAAGALARDWRHVACVALGRAELYEWLADRPDLRLAGCQATHGTEALAAVDGLVAVNSALEVDLFGQANLEVADGRAVSGAGGAPDFASAARRSRGGASIVALPATFGGSGSRIVAALTGPTLASLGRTEVDVVVTEYGSADLRGRSTHERAEAIIAVAAPQHRRALREAWSEIASRL